MLDPAFARLNRNKSNVIATITEYAQCTCQAGKALWNKYWAGWFELSPGASDVVVLSSTRRWSRLLRSCAIFEALPSHVTILLLSSSSSTTATATSLTKLSVARREVLELRAGGVVRLQMLREAALLFRAYETKYPIILLLSVALHCTTINTWAYLHMVQRGLTEADNTHFIWLFYTHTHRTQRSATLTLCPHPVITHNIGLRCVDITSYCDNSQQTWCTSLLVLFCSVEKDWLISYWTYCCRVTWHKLFSKTIYQTM